MLHAALGVPVAVVSPFARLVDSFIEAEQCRRALWPAKERYVAFPAKFSLVALVPIRVAVNPGGNVLEVLVRSLGLVRVVAHPLPARRPL